MYTGVPGSLAGVPSAFNHATNVSCGGERFWGSGPDAQTVYSKVASGSPPVSKSGHLKCNWSSVGIMFVTKIGSVPAGGRPFLS